MAGVRKRAHTASPKRPEDGAQLGADDVAAHHRDPDHAAALPDVCCHLRGFPGLTTAADGGHHPKSKKGRGGRGKNFFPKVEGGLKWLYAAIEIWARLWHRGRPSARRTPSTEE